MPNQFFSPEGDLKNYFVTEYWLIDQYIGDALWNWGLGTSGQLGDATITSKSTPVTTFAGGTNWKQVSSGGSHTAAIKTDGTLWTWGLGIFGHLGTNDTTQRNTPVTTFAGGTNWKQVSSGAIHTAAIKTDGTLWTWGSGVDGQLGTNDTTQRNTPVTTFAGGTNWKQVGSGVFHTAAIKTDGTLWTWGYGIDGQLGTNDTTARSTPVTTFAGGSSWKQVSGGFTHTAAIKTDGTLWTWGYGIDGQLGTNDTTQRNTPVTTFAGGSSWKQVSSGGAHTAAIKTDGTLWTWGQGTSGQLGNNDTTNRSTPVTTFAGGTNWKQVSGGSHTAAIKTDGTLWTWGAGTQGQLGNATFTTTNSTPVTTFAGGTNWKQVSAGNIHTAAIKTDGTLWTWGAESYGRLGRQYSTTVQVPVRLDPTNKIWADTATTPFEPDELYTLSAGTTHTAAIKTDGTLWTWGNGSNARLGTGTSPSTMSTPITTFAGGTNWKQVSAGYSHTAAVKTDGTLWTWGSGVNGQLGNNVLVLTTLQTPVTTFAGGTNWKQVSSGHSHTAAIKTDGTLWAWGAGSSGQLGNSLLTNRSTPVTTFAGGTDWKQVSAGIEHTAAVKTDGTLWTWGSGGSGRLGTNDNTPTRSTPVTTFAGGTDWKEVSAGNTHTAAVKTDGTLWTWGNASSGRLGNATTTGTISTPVTTFAGGTDWKQVTTGDSHTAAVKTDGTLWTWGSGSSGRLGNSTITSTSTPVTTFAGGTNWKEVSAGGSHTAATEIIYIYAEDPVI